MDVVTFSWRKFSAHLHGPYKWIPWTADHTKYFIKEYNANIEYIPASWKMETSEDVIITMPQDKYAEFCLKWL